MTILDSLLGLFNLQRTRENNNPYTRHPYSPRSTAGVVVTPDTALKSAAVWACVRYLSQSIAQLPVRVMQMTREGSERRPNHNVAWVLGWEASSEYGAFQFRETLIAWALLWGNGYAEIERDSAQRVVALHPIHPSRVDVRRDRETGQLFYRVNNGASGQIDLDPVDIFHVRGFGDGPIGVSVIELAADTIGWARAAELFGAAFFGEGMHPAGIVEVPGKADPGALKRMRAELEQIHKGPKKGNKVAFLDGGKKWTKTSVDPDEAQFIDTLQFQVEQICRWFGVPPHKVQHLLRATFSNIENQSIEVVQDALAPWAVRFEEEANRKLFGANRGYFFVKLDLKGMLRGDFKARQDGLQVMRRNGVINAEEWREIEDIGPMDAEGSDKYIIEGNMTTLEMVGEQPEAPEAATSAAKQDAADAEDDQAEGDQAEEGNEDDPVAALFVAAMESRLQTAAVE